MGLLFSDSGIPNLSGCRSSGLIQRRVPPPVNDMSVSFEINDDRGASVAAWVATPVTVKRPKSATRARRSLSIRMFAFIGEGYVSDGDISFGKDSYPFQISVDDAEVVHILQAVRNVNKLNSSTSVRFPS